MEPAFYKLLILGGAILMGIGILFWLGDKFPAIFSWLGNLPGDIKIERGNFRFYFPLATSLLLSILLSLIFWLVIRR